MAWRVNYGGLPFAAWPKPTNAPSTTQERPQPWKVDAGGMPGVVWWRQRLGSAPPAPTPGNAPNWRVNYGDLPGVWWKARVISAPPVDYSATALGIVQCSGSSTLTTLVSAWGMARCSGTIKAVSIKVAATGLAECSGAATVSGHFSAPAAGLVRCTGDIPGGVVLSVVAQGTVGTFGFATVPLNGTPEKCLQGNTSPPVAGGKPSNVVY